MDHPEEAALIAGSIAKKMGMVEKVWEEYEEEVVDEFGNVTKVKKWRQVEKPMGMDVLASLKSATEAAGGCPLATALGNMSSNDPDEADGDEVT